MDNLFTASNGDFDIQKKHINGRGEWIISSGVENQGVIGKSDIVARKFAPNTITVDMFGNVYMRDFEYKLVTHARVFSLSPIMPIDRDCLVYLTTSLKYFSKIFSYSNMASWEKVKSKGVYCPISSNGEISFNFMRRYIATLKAERVATLKAYLQATGLSNTILTESEIASLDTLRQNRLKWIEKPVCGKDGAFDVINTHSILNSQVVPDSGNIPYIGAGETNNSILSYISFDKKQIEKGNSIMIGGKTLVITYQEKDYFSNDSHNLALYYKDICNSNINLQLFLVSSLHRSLKPKYHWGDSISKSKIKNDCLMLPITKEGKIDYEFINNLINAITKLCIEELLSLKDMEISATESITQQNETLSSPQFNDFNLLLAAEPFEVYGYSDFECVANLSDESPILVGCYKSPEHLDWILSKHKYNVRLGERSGSMEKDKELFNKTRTLILYNVEDPSEIRVMEISNPMEITGKQINEMEYPENRPEDYQYEIFSALLSSESVNRYADLVNEVINKPGHLEGAPVFITSK